MTNLLAKGSSASIGRPTADRSNTADAITIIRMELLPRISESVRAILTGVGFTPVLWPIHHEESKS